MKRSWAAVVGGAGLGAAVMYLFDPEAGKGRRSVLRQRALRGWRSAGRALGVVSRIATNRSRGLLARTGSLLRARAVSDPVLAERVRSQIGHVVMHADAIDVSVASGRVTLSGRVLHDEVHRLLQRVEHVPGVVAVENQLEAYDPAAFSLADKVEPEARPH